MVMIVFGRCAPGPPPKAFRATRPRFQPRGTTLPDTVAYEAKEAVAAITLDRPAALNALTAEMKEDLLAALRRAAAEPVRAVIITGNGKGFCAGQDLREHAQILQAGGGALDTVRQHYNPIVTEIMTMPKPVIAAVNGVAAGAGAALALACDFRIAARSASLVMSFSMVGLGPDSGASWTLQRLAGPAVATEMLMLAEPVPAERALALGLLTSVVPDDELGETAGSLARRLAAGPTAAYGAVKEAVVFAAGHELAASLEKEAELQNRLGQTADHQAATMAFVRKERPTFTGR
jgi:2-(1,2-epoxy-1,2-dihydrophenyl)acetyl-CoA isomerase